MNILYCNLSPKGPIEGHRYFDAKYANLLCQLGDVALLWPEESWYSGVDEGVANIVFPARDIADGKGFLNWGIWGRGIFRHFNMREFVEDVLNFNYVASLINENQYDYVVASTIDIIAFALLRHKIRRLERVYVIEHQCSAYEHGWRRRLFDSFKNDIHHIVMEEDGVGYLQERLGIERGRIHYVPHMLNPVGELGESGAPPCEVVGISNSNDDREVQKIIDMEEGEGFFKSRGIRAILRSRSIDYKGDGLTVFSGRLGLSYGEYYGYIKNARVILLPFSEGFGMRTSGTIMDAFSSGVPVIGSPFPTMRQYGRMFPDICLTYDSMDELKGCIEMVLGRSEGDFCEEYAGFCDAHSDGTIVQKLKEAFS